MSIRHAFGLLGSLLALTGVADADDGAVTPPSATASPGFVNLERFDSNSRAGMDLTYLVVDSEDDVTVLRLDLHGHYVDRRTGFGGYAQVPLAMIFENGDSSTALGNLEVGAIFIPRLSTPGLGLVLHAGLTLPTGSNVSDEDVFAGYVTGFIRPTDLYQVLPRSSTLRLGVSPMVRSGNLFGRLDLGVDLNLYVDDDGGGFDVDPALHLNAGVGVDLASVAIMGEISALRIMSDDADSLVVGALSVRGKAANVQPYGSLVLPLDDDVSDIFDLGILGGVEFAF